MNRENDLTLKEDKRQMFQRLSHDDGSEIAGVLLLLVVALLTFVC